MEMRSSVKIRCQLAEARRAGECVRAFLQQAGCEDRDILDCELAVVEACNNAIKYATGAARRLPVLVTMTCDPDLIEFQIVDHTAGFQWPRRAELPPAGSESGRGIYLMQTVMDSAEYQRGKRENTLVLCRLRAVRRTPSPSAHHV